MEMLLETQTALAPRTRALQRDVGGERVVARAHGGIARDPIADRQTSRVGSDGTNAAYGAGTWDHRQGQEILALAAENLFGVGQHTGRRDIDDDFASAKHWVGYGVDDKGRAERLQNGSFHGVPPSWVVHRRRTAQSYEGLVLS